MESVQICGVRIDRLSLRDVILKIESFIEGDGKHQICVVPVYSLVLMQKDKEFMDINNNCSIVVADGMPLVWVSRLFGKPVPERIAGYDLFFALCKIALEKKYSFFFLGSSEDVLKRISLNLKNKFPDLKIAGTYSPPYKENFTEDENSGIIEEINKVKPDILWVGMTAPKQEKWIYHNLEKLNVKVAIGVGAVFDFIAGTKKRAPKWMQKIGLEWFWRLIQEPKRLWKRYLMGNTIFIWLVLKEFIKIRLLGRRFNRFSKKSRK